MLSLEPYHVPIRQYPPLSLFRVQVRNTKSAFSTGVAFNWFSISSFSNQTFTFQILISFIVEMFTNLLCYNAKMGVAALPGVAQKYLF